MNDDGFACLGDRAIPLDGAGDAQGAAKCCIDFLIAQLEANGKAYGRDAKTSNRTWEVRPSFIIGGSGNVARAEL